MNLLNTIKSTLTMGSHQPIPPHVDSQLYTPLVRISLQELINTHHYQLSNKDLLGKMTSKGYAFIGTEVCQQDLDLQNYVIECTKKFGSLTHTSPIHIVYGPTVFDFPPENHNFILSKAIFTSRFPPVGLYHTFVRYALPK